MTKEKRERKREEKEEKRGARRNCLVGCFQGVYRDCESASGRYFKQMLQMKIRCGRWDCPRCRIKKGKRLLKRAMSGKIAKDAEKAGYRERFNYKLLTLTYGGGKKRESTSPVQAAKEMQSGFEKLIKALREQVGMFHYIKVFEQHEDGWPHLHVLLSGENIAHWSIRASIEKLWRYKYHLGFIKINVVDSVKQAVRYVLKYLFKCVAVYPGVHMFSSSSEALERALEKIRRQWEMKKTVWAESSETYIECERLLQELGDEELKVSTEWMPVPGCPF